MITLLVTMSLAFAQDVGDFRYTTDEVALKRYRNSEEVSTTVKKGVKVEVVAVGKQLIRIRSGRDFGWLTAKQLSEEQPAK